MINLSSNVAKYVKRYLDKSKDTKEELTADGGIVYDLGDRGWVEYEVIGPLFWIRTMYWDTKDNIETQEIWSDVKKFAKLHGCTKVQFTTKRDGKLWSKRFKDMKVMQWKIEASI